MKICGTVRRPVISIIASRSAGLRSTRISWISSTPRRFSSILARMQNRQISVVYIFTWAMVRLLMEKRLRAFLHRQICLPPALQAAGQHLGLLVAQLAQHAGGAAGACAGRAHQHQRQGLVAGQLLVTLKLAKGN